MHTMLYSASQQQGLSEPLMVCCMVYSASSPCC